MKFTNLLFPYIWPETIATIQHTHLLCNICYHLFTVQYDRIKMTGLLHIGFVCEFDISYQFKFIDYCHNVNIDSKS